MSRDNWRVEVHSLGLGNPFTINPIAIKRPSNPILYGIAESFSIFRGAFSDTGANFWKAYVLNNPLFCRSKNDSNCISVNLFNNNANFYQIAKLGFCDFFLIF